MIFNNRIAILFIHGFVGGCYDFNNYPNELQLYRNFDVYTFTLPAHEKNTVKNVKYQDWIKESERQLNILINNNYKKIYIIGHSMGGVIATYLASKYVEVKKLVLVAPAFRYFYFKDGKLNIKNFEETVRNIPTLFKELGSNTVIERMTKTPLSTMLEFTKLVNNHLKDTENIICPTLIIQGKNDTVVPKESTEYVYNTIKSDTVKLINMDKLTHDCFRCKRNDELRNIITTFLINKNYKKKETIDI